MVAAVLGAFISYPLYGWFVLSIFGVLYVRQLLLRGYEDERVLALLYEDVAHAAASFEPSDQPTGTGDQPSEREPTEGTRAGSAAAPAGRGSAPAELSSHSESFPAAQTVDIAEIAM